MTESTDTPDSLEERLRSTAEAIAFVWPQHKPTADLMVEAADAIESLRAGKRPPGSDDEFDPLGDLEEHEP